MVFVIALTGCGDRASNASDSGQSDSTASTVPVNVTNWDLEAGSVMVVAMGDNVAIVFPQVTDSTTPFPESGSVRSDLATDLFGKSGKIASAIGVTPITRAPPGGDCVAWPAGQLKTPRSDWRVGFETGRVTGVPLDSLEGKAGADSAALAASIAAAVAALPSAANPDFRGLPFRVRSAHSFRTDSIEVLIADVVRSVNEEANPRLEHYFVIAERPAGSGGKYRIGFYSRTAGAEDDVEITELLAVVLIGPERRPAAVVNVEVGEGGTLGLLQRTAPGQWRFRWRSAYTGC